MLGQCWPSVADAGPAKVCRDPHSSSAAADHNPTNTRRSPNVGTMLAQRLQGWHNIVPAFVFAGLAADSTQQTPNAT